MTTTPFTTPRDLLRYAVTLQYRPAVLRPWQHGSADEAAYLILHTLKLPLDLLDPFLDAKLLPKKSRR
jgi:ribosomal protein L3 glutamine methyltransferase